MAPDGGAIIKVAGVKLSGVDNWGGAARLLAEIEATRGRGDRDAKWADGFKERNHQGLGNELITPAVPAAGGIKVRCRDRLGGLLRYYHRAA